MVRESQAIRGLYSSVVSTHKKYAGIAIKRAISKSQWKKEELYIFPISRY